MMYDFTHEYSITLQSLLCLFALLLQRHKSIVELAHTYVLSDQEFVTMSNTMDAVLSVFQSRLHVLLECWRQQRLDIKLQLESFADGLFQDYWTNFYEDVRPCNVLLTF